MYSAELTRALASKSDRSTRLFWRVAVASTAAGCGIAAAALLAPWWFPVLFGSQWHDAASYSLLLAPAFGSIVACSPLFCFHLTGFNSWQLGWDSLRLSVLVTVIWIAGFEYKNATLTISLFSALTSGAYLLGMGLSWKTIQCAEQVSRPAVVTV